MYLISSYISFQIQNTAITVSSQKMESERLRSVNRTLHWNGMGRR